MRKSILTLVFMSLSYVAFAGGGGVVVVGGGIGVTGPQNEVYLLDFFNAQVHNIVMLKPPTYTQNRYSVRNLRATGLDEDIKTAVVSHINWIYSADPIFVDVLYKTIGLHDWIFTDEPLQITPYASPFQIEKRVVQLAVRTGNQVTINLALWNKLSLVHKIGLIFHEAVSALADTHVNNERVRRLVVKIFTAYAPYEILTELDEGFPSIHQLNKRYPKISIKMKFSPLDSLRASDEDEYFEQSGEYINISTSKIMISLQGGELRLFPFVVYKMNPFTEYVTAPNVSQYGHFYTAQQLPALLSEACEKNPSDIQVSGHYLTTEHLSQVRIYFQRINVFSTKEDAAGDIQPKIDWEIEPYRHFDQYDFKPHTSTSKFVDCEDSIQKRLLGILLNDLTAYSPIIDVMFPN